MFILGYYTVKNVHGLQMSNAIEKESKKKERKKEGFPGAATSYMEIIWTVTRNRNDWKTCYQRFKIRGSQEKLFLESKASNFIKKENLPHMFSHKSSWNLPMNLLKFLRRPF